MRDMPPPCVRPRFVAHAGALAFALPLALLAPGAIHAQTGTTPGSSVPPAGAPTASPSASITTAADRPRNAPGLPSLEELEARGVRIGRIVVITDDIFDTEDPAENRALFRWANALHVRTHPSVIEHALLFRRGDRLSLARLDETERLLRRDRFLHDVQIRAIALQGDEVDLEVRTRDTWSLDPGLSAGRSGGATTSGFRLKEYNLLGTGTALSLGRSNGVDRSGNTVQFTADRIWGSWVSLDLQSALNSDGRRDEVTLARPFVALDSRWSAGVHTLRDERIDPVYDAGQVVGGTRRVQHQAELYAGWSRGLRDGWVHRFTAGTMLREDLWAPAPGLTVPATLPDDERYAAPFVRWDLIEDRFDRQANRNLMGRPEFFAMGLSASVQLGWIGRQWASPGEGLLYEAAVSRGFTPADGHTVVGALHLSGRLSDGRVARARSGGSIQYYRPQGPRRLFFASAAGDVLTRPGALEVLPLGGDNGLRGYPLRYQNGTRRVLLSAEQRVFTDTYAWRLFRLGGAVFADVGRAWGGPLAPQGDAGWLRDAGVGLRLVSTRAAFSNVLHVDLAFPMGAPAEVRKVQFLVKTKATF
jgi:hypothetical protein